MGVVFDIVRRAIGPGYVVLYTLGGGGSTGCVNLYLVCRAMGSFFYWVDSTLSDDGYVLGVGMNTLGSEAWGWKGA